MRRSVLTAVATVMLLYVAPAAAQKSRPGSIRRAHLVGAGQLGADGKTAARVGNYTRAQIAEKARILRDGGISRRDRRRLMEAGVVGLADFLARTIGTIDARTGQRVRIRAHQVDDWGSTSDYVEVKNPITGRWERRANVPGSYRSNR